MYKLILPRRIERQLDKLSDYTCRIITSRLKELEQNPFGGNSVRLLGYRNLWKKRMAAYTLYYEIDEDQKKVIVMALVAAKP